MVPVVVCFITLCTSGETYEHDVIITFSTFRRGCGVRGESGDREGIACAARLLYISALALPIFADSLSVRYGACRGVCYHTDGHKGEAI